MSPVINKFLVALAGAAALLAYLAVDGMTTEEWRAVIISFATAVGVWTVPNTQLRRK